MHKHRLHCAHCGRSGTLIYFSEADMRPVMTMAVSMTQLSLTVGAHADASRALSAPMVVAAKLRASPVHVATSASGSAAGPS